MNREQAEETVRERYRSGGYSGDPDFQEEVKKLMSDQKPTNGHPNPFTLEPLDTPSTFEPLSASDVATLRARQEAAISQSRREAIAAEGNRGNVKQSRDKAQYVRQQKGHSLTLFLLTDIITMYIRTIYYSVSPNHYWHI